ncbi:hypothetical protein [Staphylococcus phage PMBT8]|nr:hypothetical protein [Staphylococcus phage PMBT8]
MRKLTTTDIQEIYVSTQTQKELASQYNVSIPLISNIMNGKIYRRYTSTLKKPQRKKYNREPRFTQEQIINIYTSLEPINTIAKRYSVARETISRIKNDVHYTEFTKELSNPKIHKRIDRLDVIDIYLDDRSAKEIAQEYRTSISTVYNIKNKKCHRNITDELDKDY